VVADLQHLINKSYMQLITHAIRVRFIHSADTDEAVEEQLMQVLQHSAVIVTVTPVVNLAARKAIHLAAADLVPVELAYLADVA
jgi:hypothetical protein